MSATAELARAEAYFLNDAPVMSRDRIVTGREVLTRAGLKPPSDYRLILATAGRTQLVALDAEIETGVGNGRVLAYLAQHAQIRNRTYDEDRVLLSCRLPRRCLDFLNENGAHVRTDGQRLYA